MYYIYTVTYVNTVRKNQFLYFYKIKVHYVACIYIKIGFIY